MEWTNALFAYVLFWAIIYFAYEILGVKKENIVIKPFFLMVKTSLLNDWIKKLSMLKRNLSVRLLNLGVAAGIIQIGYIIYFLIRNLNMLMQRAEQAAGFVLLLPGLTISWETFPYIIFALFITLATHELAHGIASAIDGIPLKSAGVFLAVILPGGFVEIDEKRLNKAKLMTKLRVFAAGSYANIVTWGLVILLLSNFAVTISPFYNSDSSGVLITGLVNDGPAQQEGLKRWDVIYSLNESSIKEVKDLRNYMENIPANSNLIINSSSGIINIETQPHPTNSDMAAIGIYPFNYHSPHFSWLPRSAPYHIYILEFWASIILLWIALFNMVPIYPLDGDKFLYSLLEKFSSKYSRIIRISISIFCLTLLGSNFVISTLIFGFVRV